MNNPCSRLFPYVSEKFVTIRERLVCYIKQDYVSSVQSVCIEHNLHFQLVDWGIYIPVEFRGTSCWEQLLSR